jgi:hypothetical protein
MWKCNHCGESIEDTQFECWKCGSDRDGVRNPDFDRVLFERDAEPQLFKMWDSWVCPKCGGKYPTLSNISSLVMSPGRQRNRVQIECTACDFSEIGEYESAGIDSRSLVHALRHFLPHLP